MTTQTAPTGNWLARDFTASVVVFLVAMPLCMGIAIASGAPPEKGLITGIIGGIVVGALAGSPLQVSGPAAGLAVIVFEIIRDQGLSALGPILFLAGLIQVIAGICRLGGWFRAISPAVVHGMLAGIGLLIVVGQYHVLFDAKPLPGGLENLAAMPSRLLGLAPGGDGAISAFAIGVMTIAAMFAWEKLRPQSLRLVPAALVGVVLATLTAWGLDLDVVRVTVPETIMGAVTLPEGGFLAQLTQPAIITTAIAIAFIASAETLLSAAAVDRMHNGVRTSYNRELSAQGVGNLLCGVLGALPMTGVIVRSSANVQAGAQTRLSAILHGVWILGFVALLPWLLREIPMSALAGVLVVTGAKLVSLVHVKHLRRRYGLLPAAIWASTFIGIVATDLLTGVLIGLALSMAELLPHATKLRLGIEERGEDETREIVLQGSATFVTLPKLSAALDRASASASLRLNVEGLRHIDHICAEMLTEWIERHRQSGREVELQGASGRMKTLAV